MASAGGSGGGNSIKVVARFRPQNKIEVANGGQPIVKFDGDETVSVASAEANAPFTFDRVFNMSSRQSDIFEYSIRSTVEDVMNGYNGTVFAYGQTGAGKSYTMMGDMVVPEKRGIIPRIVEQIFDAILVHGSSNVEYTVGICYLEIYMEKIRDLLNPANNNLNIHESNNGPYVKDLREIYVNQVEEVFEAMDLGQKSRVIASTNMNAESSRSHSIFQMNINQRDVDTGSAKKGTLYLVDLAGSEKVGKTGATGQTLEEAKKINKSLSALGMVINALTDGKSTHIPYRDSKLTRILQESLGGNSRTTLIINCSPSSYNDAETVSTLRFGMRAKSIKNKAKVNAELSPAELKKQLKVVQHQMMSFEKYVAGAEAELKQWRTGGTVPQDKWVQPVSSTFTSKSETKSRPPGRPETPSRLLSDTLRADTPSRPDSRTGDRASTPSIILEKDEREDFIRRENELQDQLTEKENQAANAERALQELKDELRTYRENQARISKENESVNDRLNKTQMELQKLSFQRGDEAIEMERIRNDNDELDRELHKVQQELLSLKMSAKETTAVLEEKDRKKHERMARMLAGFDLGNDAFTENERRMQDMLDQVDGLEQASVHGQQLPTELLAGLKAKILESQALSRQAESSLSDRGELSIDQDSRRVELEERLLSLEKEHEQLLTRNLSEADVEDVKKRLSELYTDQGETQGGMITDLRNELTTKEDEINKLRKSLADRQSNGTNGVVNGAASRTLQQQMADFDMMKKNLMRDLQNRCERVVELEISLDETREQYNNVLRSSNNKQQQKKMAFLERNLEQLTVVQRHLVDQNTALKKEVAIAERKLLARNDRIMSLEQLLGDSQEKLTQANHRFEAQLQAVKERLESAKASQANRGVSQTGGAVGGGYGGLSFGARIAKPLRGGAGAANNDSSNGGPSIPYLTQLTGAEGTSPASKRSSWFFNNR